MGGALYTGHAQTNSDEMKTKIGKYAAENGNSYAITKFSNKLGWVVPDTTL